MTQYEPTLTFEANARILGNLKGPGRDQDVANALREAYADGWLDARARQLTRHPELCLISECPGKE